MMQERSRSVVAEVYAALRAPAMTPGWWALLVAVTAGTNLADLFAATQPGARTSAAFALAALVRVLLVFWIGYALLRRLGGVARPLKVTGALFRYALFGIGLIALLAGCSLLAGYAVPDSMLARMFLTYGLLTVAVMALAPLYAWQAALAAGDRSFGPGGLWQALRSCHADLAMAYLAILPVALIHAGLTFAAIRTGAASAALALLALVGGLVSAVQLVLMAALAVIGWRLAGGHSPSLRDCPPVA